MPLVTVHNRLDSQLALPSPFSTTLSRRGSVTIQATTSQLEASELSGMVRAGLISVTTADDPSIVDTLESATRQMAEAAGGVSATINVQFADDDAQQLPLELATESVGLLTASVAYLDADENQLVRRQNHHVTRAANGDYTIVNTGTDYTSGNPDTATFALTVDNVATPQKLFFLAKGAGADYVPATGSITLIAGNLIADGETVEIGDGIRTVTFEFDKDASVVETADLRAVVIDDADTAGEVRTAFAAAFAAVMGEFGVTSSLGAGATLNFTSSTGTLTIVDSSAALTASTTPEAAAVPLAGQWVARVTTLAVPSTSN